MGCVTEGAGKRKGARRAAPAPSRSRGKLLVLAFATTACLVAWGYLVWAAIDFGRTARGGGSSQSWLFLVIASVGAMACLFAGLRLAVRVLKVLGSVSDVPTLERIPGGRRAKR